MWVVCRYEPNTRIEFVRVNVLRTMSISIALTDNGDGTTRAVNELLLVGLTEQGNQALNELSKNFSFEFSMGEVMLNHYLTTGNMLPLQESVAIASKQK
ncbi:MAG: hypothetical protein HZB61_14245 [Nitrospirae bacterium]|nr:hypothetical protein [Nitrospirota bacterium]